MRKCDIVHQIWEPWASSTLAYSALLVTATQMTEWITDSQSSSHLVLRCALQIIDEEKKSPGNKHDNNWDEHVSITLSP